MECLNFHNFLLIRYYAKLKKMEEEREQELASKYRDRVSKKLYTCMKADGLRVMYMGIRLFSLFDIFLVFFPV